MELNKIVRTQCEKLLNRKEVVALLLFGSYARGEKFRDIDLCVILDKKYSNIEMSRIKLAFTSALKSKFDVKVFQQLPVYVKIRVIGDGKIVFCKDEDKLYELAFETVKEFESYRKIYEEYLSAMEND